MKEIEVKGLPITEKQLEQQVKELAKLFGWKCYHPFLSKWSVKGFPDITLVRENEDGTASLLFLELKSGKGKVSEEQREWLDILGKVPGVIAKCVYPHDFDEIVELLIGERG